MSTGQASFVTVTVTTSASRQAKATGSRQATGRQPWAAYIFQLELEVPMHYFVGAQADKVISTLFPAIGCSLSPHESQARTFGFSCVSSFVKIQSFRRWLQSNASCSDGLLIGL
jgi:hypothetical protein